MFERKINNNKYKLKYKLYIYEYNWIKSAYWIIKSLFLRRGNINSCH